MMMQGAAGRAASEEGGERGPRWQGAAAVGVTGGHRMVLRAALHPGAPLPAGRQQVSMANRRARPFSSFGQQPWLQGRIRVCEALSGAQ